MCSRFENKRESLKMADKSRPSGIPATTPTSTGQDHQPTPASTGQAHPSGDSWQPNYTSVPIGHPVDYEIYPGPGNQVYTGPPGLYGPGGHVITVHQHHDPQTGQTTTIIEEQRQPNHFLHCLVSIPR